MHGKIQYVVLVLFSCLFDSSKTTITTTLNYTWIDLLKEKEKKPSNREVGSSRKEKILIKKNMLCFNLGIFCKTSIITIMLVRKTC